jgi:hypothetical protein
LFTKEKNYFFFAESTLAFKLSFAAVAVESIAVLAESAIAVTLSFATDAVESTLASVLAEPLQAAKAPIAKMTKSFFIVICLCVNDLLLIQQLKKSNLRSSIKSEYFFQSYVNN